MKAGDALPGLTHVVEPVAMKVVAEVLRDPNPIHLDPAAAAAAGLGDRVINQGPANLGYIVNMLQAALPQYRIAGLESRYLANVRGGDVVSAGGTVTAVEGDVVQCEVWLKGEGGAIAVGAVAKLVRRG